MGDHLTAVDVLIINLYEAYPAVEIACKSFAILFAIGCLYIFITTKKE